MRKRCPAFPEPHGTQNLPVSPHLPGKSGEITLRPCFLQAQTAWLRASLFPVGSPPAPKQLLPVSLRVRGLALLARGSLPPSTRAQSEMGRWCWGEGGGRSVQQGLENGPLRGHEEASILFLQNVSGRGRGSAGAGRRLAASHGRCVTP